MKGLAELKQSASTAATAPEAAQRQPSAVPLGLVAYVSPLLTTGLADVPEAGSEPAGGTLQVAALQADMSGFTALAERLAREGPRGADPLSELINACFGVLVSDVERHGGHIVHFPGDAVIALWPAQAGREGQAVVRAVQCANDLLDHFAASIAAHDHGLGLRVGIGAGEVAFGVVGGCMGRWETYVGGPALLSMAMAEQASERGCVFAAREAVQWAGPDLSYSSDPSRGAVRVDAVLRRLVPEPVDPVVPTADQLNRWQHTLPRALTSRLSSRYAAWLAELRTVTVVFFRFAEGVEAAALPVSRIHVALRQAQAVLYRFEGTIDKLLMDDKGLVLIAAFGLPPLTHEEDPARAVLAAMGVVAELQALGLDPVVGVATGRIYCGDIGAAGRCEYSLLGSAVNRAARLMAWCKNGILCDEATAKAAAGRLRFEDGGAANWRGSEQPVATWRPLAWDAGDPALPGLALQARATAVLPRVRIAQQLIGRGQELERCIAVLSQPAANSARVVALSGDPGIGKSALLARAQFEASALGMAVWSASCDEMDSATAWRPWRQILAAAAGLRGPTLAVRRAAWQRWLTKFPVAGAETLAHLLGVGPPPAAQPISGEAAHEINELALLAALDAALAAATAGGRTCLLCIEDAHWMDADSWSLLTRLLRGRSGALLFLTVRSAATAQPAVSELLNDPRVVHIALAGLDHAATRQLLVHALHCKEVAADLVAWTVARVQGNPYFVEELSRALADGGHLDLTGGVARLAAGVEGRAAADVVPHSIEGVVASRIDRLNLDAQMLLKTASVMGRDFELEAVRAIHPAAPAPALLDHALGELLRQDVVRHLPSRGADAYQFKHAITQAAVYGRLLAGQRSSLHGNYAAYLQQLRERGGEVTDAALFYHFEAAGQTDQCLAHVQRAGRTALAGGLYSEAARYFGYGATAAPDHYDAALVAEWQCGLGEAQVALGNHEGGLSSLASGLTALGTAVPKTTAGAIWHIALQFLRQLATRIGGGRRQSPADSARQVRAAEGWEQLGYIYYATGATLGGVLAALRMLNLAEGAQPSPVLARALANAALACALMAWRSGALRYLQLAQGAANLVGDAGTTAHVRWVEALCHAGVADWARADAACGEAAPLASMAHQVRLQTMVLQTWASCAYLRGDMALATRLTEEQLAIATERGNRLWQVWALSGRAEIHLAQADFAAAEADSAQATALLDKGQDAGDVIRAVGIHALALTRSRQWEAARQRIDHGLEVAKSADITAFSALEGYAGLAEAAQILAFANQGSPATAQAALRALHRFGAVFPIAGPRLLWLQARHLHREGRIAAAQVQIANARKRAVELAMPLELSRMAAVSEGDA